MLVLKGGEIICLMSRYRMYIAGMKIMKIMYTRGKNESCVDIEEIWAQELVENEAAKVTKAASKSCRKQAAPIPD